MHKLLSDQIANGKELLHKMWSDKFMVFHHTKGCSAIREVF